MYMLPDTCPSVVIDRCWLHVHSQCLIVRKLTYFKRMFHFSLEAKNMFYEKTENLHFCDKLLIHFVPVIIRLNAVLKCTHSQTLETAHEYKEIQE